MDVLVLVVLGLVSLALFVAGGFDAVRSRRERRTPRPVVPVPVGPRHLVLVRHGETEWSRTGRHTGRTDVPLTDEGRDQARRAGAQLQGWSFDAVFVSPLQRARETLTLLDRPEPATVLDDLQEWEYGEDEGRTTGEIRTTRPGWSVWADGPMGGETVEDVGLRADRALRLAAAHEGDVLIVAHGHLLRVLAARWLQLHPAAGRVLALDAGTVSVLDREREQPVVRRWNVSG